MAAYDIALRSQVDCIEIDVSRSSDGVLLALHDRYFRLSNIFHFSVSAISSSILRICHHPNTQLNNLRSVNKKRLLYRTYFLMSRMLCRWDLVRLRLASFDG